MAHYPLKPISTRSALLTLLIAADVPMMTTRELVMTAVTVGYAEPTVRVALSRMSMAGDVLREDDGSYRLSDRLRERQRQQEEAAYPRIRAWNGEWAMFVVTTSGRSASARAQTRTDLLAGRLAELREGVWIRPANLDIRLPADVGSVSEQFTCRPSSQPVGLAGRLWDLEEWSATAHRLLAGASASESMMRFTACALAGRHLFADPVLPDELLPRDWPGHPLRTAHIESRKWVNDIRRQA